MADQLEREIKLRFASPEQARAAVLAIGATALRPRRLQHDALLDTDEGLLLRQRSALRVRNENGRAIVTFKGPPLASTMKVREEIETAGGEPSVLLRIFERIGFRVKFIYEKQREEFAKDRAVIAVDETPVGTFVEIEGDESSVTAVASALGREPRDYILESYRGLYVRDCEVRGVPVSHMLFDRG